MKPQPTYNPIELLQKWLKGDARHEEERQLEHLAADDPFLADALEGLRNQPAGNHSERVERIKAQVRTRSQKRKGILFYLPRAAAAAVVVGLLAGGFWLINSGTGNKPVAMEQTEKAASPASPATTDANAGKSNPAEAPTEEGQVRQQEANGEAEEQADAFTIAKAEERTPELAQVKPLPSAAPAITPPPPAQIEAPSPETKEFADAAVQPAPARAATDAERPAADSGALTSKSNNLLPAGKKSDTSRLVRGTVVDSNGNPLIGANVLIPGSSQGTVTDFDGKFQLNMPAGENQIEVTYTGYSSAWQKVDGDEPLKITLAESMVMDEVVVTGYGKEAKRQNGAKPKPAAGFNQFKKYIRDNLRYPEAARKNGTEGTVEVSFMVQPDGSLSDLKIVKGLGNGCSEEALRLLREGPKWNGAGQKGSYVVEFKIK